MKTKHGPDPVTLACLLLLLLLTFLFLATILLGSVPPVDRDALTHHLFVPKLWLQYGGIYEIPEIPFSYYPMNLDLLYTIPLYFGNDIVPKYIHYFFALATALLLYRHLAKRLGTQYGLLGALFFLSIPIIVKLSITVYVDLGVVFFSTAALLLLLHWAEESFQFRYLVLAGLCCGLAAGTKYNGLITIVVLTFFVPMIYQQNAPKEQQSNSKALLWGIVFAAATLTSFSPWLIKNYAWTGNPIYPLHKSLFQQLKNPDITKRLTESANIAGTLQQITSQGSNAFIFRKITYNEHWWQALFLPIRFFYEGQDDNPQFFDGKLTPFLLLLPALTFLFRSPHKRQRLEQKTLLSFALLYFFFTFFQEAMRIRYIVPIVPPLVILSMYGLHGLHNSISLRTKTVSFQKTAIFFAVFCVPGLMLWYNAQYLASQFATVNPLPYLQGKISRDEYITTFRPEYPAIQWLNKHTNPNNHILCIFLGNRGYHMNFFPIFFNPYDGPLPFSTNNYSYVLTRDDMFLKWLDYTHNKKIINNIPIGTESLIYSTNGHSIYTVTNTIR